MTNGYPQPVSSTAGKRLAISGTPLRSGRDRLTQTTIWCGRTETAIPFGKTSLCEAMVMGNCRRIADIECSNVGKLVQIRRPLHVGDKSHHNLCNRQMEPGSELVQLSLRS